MEEENEWEEIEPSKFEIWIPKDKGDAIEGKLLCKKTNVGKNNAMAYEIETKNGKILSAYGSTVLNDLMKLIEEGKIIKIEYLGLIESEKAVKPYHGYKVYRKRS